ncbi:hypothetical protein GCM10009549_38210 [Streptomyces thermoalcalitolerans]|uniref:Uncharacterized protein n=1 Tax=Streptomyces thermoalcalitolerans TaxID=65605 RepID=A0ABP3ZG88_9ACTN
MFRIVQKDKVRFPPEIVGRLFHSRVQPYRIQGVLPAIPPREVSDLRGDRELRQQITGCLRQDLVRAKAEVVGAGVKCGDTEIKRPGQDAAFVTRSV